MYVYIYIYIHIHISLKLTLKCVAKNLWGRKSVSLFKLGLEIGR